MKFKNQLKVFILSAFVFSQLATGQGSKAVSSGVNFEQYPVELSTGLPRVSIPLYSMPTHSKDINIDISLNYHPSSIARSGFRSGNCGRGWNLSLGGVLQRSNKNSIMYSFNFMGFSGKFYILNTANGSITTITENKGGQLYAETFFGPNNVVQSINFYDNKGYKYSFSTIDVINITLDDDDAYPENDVIVPQNMSIQLTDIYDTNNNLLAHFNYTPGDEIVKIHGITKHNTINMILNIQVPGFGTILMDQGPLQDDLGAWFMYYSFVVKDVLNNEVKNVVFNHDIVYDYDQHLYTVNQLLNVWISGAGQTDPQAYNLSYHPIPVNNELSQYMNGFDIWGYPNTFSRYCKLNPKITSLVDKKNIMGGVLEKIKYPTGGSVIYEYESNTYAYTGNMRMDEGLNGTTDANYYYDEASPENRHNFLYTELTNIINTNFTTGQSQYVDVYIKLHGDPTYVSTGGSTGGWTYPIFYLRNVTSGQVYQLDTADNEENDCLGHLLNLQPGQTYRIEMGSTGTNPQISVYTIDRISTPNRFWHGGGIRVKTVSFFSDDAPQDYFYSTVAPSVVPVKSTFYKYNSFTEPTMSSGSLLYLDDLDPDYAGLAPITYANVSVSDAISNKRTDYTFYSPLDSAEDYTYGKLKSSKIYNSQNVLQQETTIDYTTLVAPGGTNTADYEMGWMMPSQSLTNEYLGSTLVTKENYEYDTYRNIKKKTVATSRSTESLISNYYYHLDANGNPYTTNRVSLIDHIDELVGTTPLGTSKIAYSNIWTDTQGNNTSYLPSQMLGAKGALTPELKVSNNKYDLFGNLLESEQANGIKKSFIWGYNNTMIVAEITGVAYSSIPQANINAVKAASDSGNEASLLTELTNLRNTSAVSAGFITTYTHKPLVGISTMTDARGNRVKYEYDSNGRQIAVKDQDGNIVSQTLYHTKPSN